MTANYSRGKMVLMEGERNTYGEWYFEELYKYGRKRLAVQRLYFNTINWASRYANWDILDGRGKSALDIGCAFGFIVDLLNRLGYDSYGIDRSNHALKRGKTILKKSNLILADAQSLPLKKESFNLITCFETIEHVIEPVSMLESIYALLRRGGVFIMTTPVPGVMSNLIIHGLARVPRWTHPSVKQPGEWVSLLKSLGFSNIHASYSLLMPIPATLFNRYYSVKCAKPFSTKISTIAQKRA